MGEVVNVDQLSWGRSFLRWTSIAGISVNINLKLFIKVLVKWSTETFNLVSDAKVNLSYISIFTYKEKKIYLLKKNNPRKQDRQH